jgi:hypothetical protein
VTDGVTSLGGDRGLSGKLFQDLISGLSEASSRN